MSWVVMLWMLPVTLATVLKFVPSELTWMLKSRVFNRKSSPPAPACSTTNRPMLTGAPRSTVRDGLAAEEHHLSPGPLSALPLTALSEVWLAAHGALPVA